MITGVVVGAVVVVASGPEVNVTEPLPWLMIVTVLGGMASDPPLTRAVNWLPPIAVPVE